MAQVQPPLRRRDRNSRMGGDYYDPIDPPYYADRRGPYIVQDQPPSSSGSSRRGKSEQPPSGRSRKHDRARSERAPPPRDYGDMMRDDPYEPRRRGRPESPPEDMYKPRRGHSRREPPPRLAASPPSKPRTRRGPSPPPYGAESPRMRDPRHGRDPYERNPYELPIREQERNRMPARGYPPSPPPDPYGRRGMPRGYMEEPDPRMRRGRGSPPREARSMPRGRPYDYDDYDSAPRTRPRSQAPPPRGYGMERSPPRQRSRPPASSGNRGGNPELKRRNSMPSSSKAQTQAQRNSWWKHPLVQAGARTALTAGAQAAMKARNDQGSWMGPRGAKVATAALGAALVDGFIGNKSPSGNKVAKQGVDAAAEEMHSRML